VIDWTEIPDGDAWELFARDMLAALGFVIEVGPGRGADAGRDLVVSEQLKGRLANKKFTWLVSCKHYATSGKSVGPGDEQNITDRLRQHGADGFLGFYSTMPSSGLVDRLRKYESDETIAGSEIFDAKRIEGYFVEAGLSTLVLRYMPQSYARMRPIQAIFGQRAKLDCEVCGADLLEGSILDPYKGAVITAFPRNNASHAVSHHVVCKGACDRQLQDRLRARGQMTGWEDIGDLANPMIYLQNMMAYMNHLHAGHMTFSEEAHEAIKHVYIALAQRTLRELTDEDKKRFASLDAVRF
jgi:hypothetical protein